jgi:hypothetical protein
VKAFFGALACEPDGPYTAYQRAILANDAWRRFVHEPTAILRDFRTELLQQSQATSPQVVASQIAARLEAMREEWQGRLASLAGMARDGGVSLAPILALQDVLPTLDIARAEFETASRGASLSTSSGPRTPGSPATHPPDLHEVVQGPGRPRLRQP